MSLTRAERGLKIIEDLSKSNKIKDKEMFRRKEIQYLLNNSEELGLTQADIDQLKQEFLKYL